MARALVAAQPEEFDLARELSRGVRFLHASPAITIAAMERQQSLPELKPWHREEVDRHLESVPYELRPLFVYEWGRVEGALQGVYHRADTRKVLAKAFLGRYVLAWARVEGCSVLAACDLFAKRIFRDLLHADGHIGPVASLLRLAEVAVEKRPPDDLTLPLRLARTGKPLLASIIRNWCFEADVPDPELAVRGDWSTPEAIVSVARFLATYTMSEFLRGALSELTSQEASMMARWPKSRIRARANWKTPMLVPAEDRRRAREVIEQVVSHRAAEAGLSLQERRNLRAKWSR